ncbi:hypothetical protein [Dethiosulfatarculus sandiegensis]|uniref:hypothetical protein n=1 Tax=Dethiosulfatarculus sandiegensis TaxID=1429043 RepID=UPI0012E208F6|nr:hypothetical protein [Dethiosulfatarculus sandiegensis]
MKLGLSSITTFVFLLCLSSTQPVWGERVFIEHEKGEQGQGWLFGAKDRLGDIQCWVALPAHVAKRAKTPNGQPLKAFTFKTMAGRQGITGRPVSLHEFPLIQNIKGRNLDLAFTPVKSGFHKGECLSRLGLSSFVYDNACRKKIIVDAASVSKTRFDLFQMSVQRGGLGKTDYVQIFKPVNPKNSAAYFKGGLSGCIVTFDHLGHTHPYAMITSVDSRNLTAHGIRFDTISKVFASIRTRINTIDARTNVPQHGSLPYRIVRYEGKIDPTSTAQGMIFRTKKCWKMVPSGGQRMVRLSIEPQRHTFISGISFHRRPSCGLNAIQIGVDASYDKGDTWVRVADCALKSGVTKTRCIFSLAQATSLRITAIGRAFSLTEMRLLP